jgi:hypothetical protein
MINNGLKNQRLNLTMHSPTPEVFQALADNSSTQKFLLRRGEARSEEKQTPDSAGWIDH